ncbi:MAG: hypothetical protein NXI29_27330 [bacterium]|nr:hypothetical protein [bacterium]
MMTKNTLSLVLDSDKAYSVEVHRNVVPSEIPNALQKQGIEWLEIPVPVGKVRIPVDEDAEFLVEGYVAMELLHASKEDGTVDCILNDGGLQITWIKVGTYFETDLLIVPHLDGRFSKRMTTSMDAECHMQEWRRIVAPIFTVGCTE